jgi:hypothetical protein
MGETAVCHTPRLRRRLVWIVWIQFGAPLDISPVNQMFCPVK